MATQDSADRDTAEDTRGVGVTALPVVQTISVGKTLQHQGIEAYRQANHALLEAFEAGDGPAKETVTDRHAYVDRQGRALHEAVDEGWARFGRVMADAVAATGDVRTLPGRTGDESLALLRVLTGGWDSDRASGQGAGAATEDLQAVAGIGSSYASRLREAGIDSLEDLAAADPSIADEIDAIGVDVQDWIDQAAAHTAER